MSTAKSPQLKTIKSPQLKANKSPQLKANKSSHPEERISRQLDARRLLCPLPVIRTQDTIVKMHPGEILTVTSTDPGTKVDIPCWCRINGHEVIDIREQDNDIIIIIKVRALKKNN